MLIGGDISGEKDFIGVEVKKQVAFDTLCMAYVNAFASTRLKFCSLGSYGGGIA